MNIWVLMKHLSPFPSTPSSFFAHGSVAEDNVHKDLFGFHQHLWSWRCGTEVFNPPLAVPAHPLKQIPTPSMFFLGWLCSLRCNSVCPHSYTDRVR